MSKGQERKTTWKLFNCLKCWHTWTLNRSVKTDSWVQGGGLVLIFRRFGMHLLLLTPSGQPGVSPSTAAVAAAGTAGQCRLQQTHSSPCTLLPSALSLSSFHFGDSGGETLHHPMKEPGGGWLCAIRSDPGLSCQPPRRLLTWKQRDEPFRQNFSIPIFSLGDAPWLPSSPTDSWLSVKSQKNKEKGGPKRPEGETRLRRLLSGHRIPASLGLPLLQTSSWLMSVSTWEKLKEMIYTPPYRGLALFRALGCGIPRLGRGGSLKKQLDHGAGDQGWVRGWGYWNWIGG